MMRITIIVAVALLLTNCAWAQSEANCDEIRQAVATYGYEEARKHALIHYGAEAVEAGEKKCLNIHLAKPVVTKASAKTQQPKKKPSGPPMKLQPK